MNASPESETLELFRTVFRIQILKSSIKNGKKNLDSSCFVTSFGLLSLKNVPSKSNKGMDPRIRIRIHTKMSWIRNTGLGAAHLTIVLH